MSKMNSEYKLGPVFPALKVHISQNNIRDNIVSAPAHLKRLFQSVDHGHVFYLFFLYLPLSDIFEIEYSLMLFIAKPDTASFSSCKCLNTAIWVTNRLHTTIPCYTHDKIFLLECNNNKLLLLKSISAFHVHLQRPWSLNTHLHTTALKFLPCPDCKIHFQVLHKLNNPDLYSSLLPIKCLSIYQAYRSLLFLLALTINSNFN